MIGIRRGEHEEEGSAAVVEEAFEGIESIRNDRAKQGVVLVFGLTVCISGERRLGGDLAKFLEMKGKRGSEDAESEARSIKGVMETTIVTGR